MAALAIQCGWPPSELLALSSHEFVLWFSAVMRARKEMGPI